MDERPEGVYCSWVSYPPDTPSDNIFHVERVNGDGSVTQFECARGDKESDVILQFLKGIEN